MANGTRKDSPFELWAEGEGIPVVRGYAVEDLLAVPVETWKRKEGKGAIIILQGGQGFNAAYVCEIPPAATLTPQRHLFEEQIYVLKGKGETEFWSDGGRRQSAAWQRGSVMATPLNVWHQHRNTGSEPARYVAVINAPIVFNVFRNPDFVFNTAFSFTDRYNGEADYFDPEGKRDEEIGVGTDRPVWKVSLIPDAYASNLGETPMGTGMSIVQLNLARNSMAGHIAELEVGTYKKAHRHNPGAHIVWLSGRGYTFLWNEQGERMRIDWKPGSLISPPENCYHQHFNTSPEPARHVALRRGLPHVGRRYKPWLDVKQGGDQIEYEDEELDVRAIYEEELRKAGLELRMPAVARK